MSEELVTIGGQQFIYDESKGWIDKKTKAPANENLLKLLNTVSPNRSTQPIKQEPKSESTVSKPEEVQPSVAQFNQNPLPKIKTKKIGGVDPIVIGGEKYIYTNKGWVDKKTKSPIPEKLKALFDKLVPAAKEMGAIGAIESEKIQKKDKEKIKKSQQVIKPRINKQFVSMITILATIDSILSSRLKSVSATRSRSILSNKEDEIESMSSSPAKVDAETEKGGSSLAKIGGIAAITALLATQFDPLYEQVKLLWDFTEKSGKYINGFAGQINGFLEWFTGSTSPKSTNTESYVTSNDPVLAQQVKDKTYDQAVQPTNNTPPLIAAKPQMNQQGPVMGKPTSKKQSKIESYTQSSPNLVGKPAASTSKQVEANKQSAYVSGISTTSAKPGDKHSPMKVKPNKAAIENGVPKNDLHALRRWLKAQGFRTSEQKGYDSVGGHSKNSKHYTGDAIDVNWGSGTHEATDPVAGPKFDDLAAQLKAAGYGVIWRKKGHFGHLHVDTGGKSQVGGDGIYDTMVEGGQDVIKASQDSWKHLMQFMKVAGSTDTQFRKVGSNRSNTVEKAAMYKNKKVMESKDKKKAPVLLPELPNLNSSGGTIKLPSSSSSSKNVLNQYLKYFEQPNTMA